MFKLLRPHLVSKSLERVFRLAKSRVQKPLELEIKPELTTHLPMLSEMQEEAKAIVTFEEKWQLQREKLLRYPERIKEDDLRKTIQNIAKLSPNKLKELAKSELYRDYFLRKLPKKLSKCEDDTLVAATNMLVKTLDAESKQELVILDKIQEMLIYKDRAEFLTIEQVADLLWNYAYANRGNRAFFRKLETAIVDYDIEKGFDYRLLGKILWGLSHNDKGTTVVYSKLGKIITKIHTEISPLHLAQYAFYFSKATESMQGGFGVYILAEKSITDHIRYFKFEELLKISESMLTQNIGSNAFYALFEKRVLELYPDDIPPSYLVTLCKSTAYHMFQNKKLGTKLRKDVMKILEYLSNSQLETVLWSFVRNKLVTEEFYNIIEKELEKRMKVMTPRGIVFTFYDLALSGRINPQLLESYHEYFQANIEKLNTHYLTKVLTAISYKPYDEFTIKIFDLLAQRVNQLSNKFRKNEIVKLIEAIHNYPSINLPPNATESYTALRLLLLANTEKFTIVETCKLLFFYSNAGLLDPELETKLIEKINDARLVPKNVFAETLFALTLVGQYELALEFVPILTELGSYGDFKYFFDHSGYIRIVWSLTTLALRNNLSIQELLPSPGDLVQSTILEIDPNTLAPRVLKLYLQLLQLCKLFGSVTSDQELQISQAIQSVNDDLREELQKLEQIDPSITSAREHLRAVLTSDVVEDPELIKKDFCDEFLNVVDIAAVKDNVRIAMLLQRLSPGPNEQRLNNHAFLTNFVLESCANWEVYIIELEKWQSSSDQERSKLLRQTLDPVLRVKNKQET